MQIEHYNEMAFNLETLSSNLSRVCRAEAFSKSKQILVADVRLFLTWIITVSWRTNVLNHISKQFFIKILDFNFLKSAEIYFRIQLHKDNIGYIRFRR